MRADLPARTFREQWLLAGQSNRDVAPRKLDPRNEEVDSGDEDGDEEGSQDSAPDESMEGPSPEQGPIVHPVVAGRGPQPAARDIRLNQSMNST